MLKSCANKSSASAIQAITCFSWTVWFLYDRLLFATLTILRRSAIYSLKFFLAPIFQPFILQALLALANMAGIGPPKTAEQAVEAAEKGPPPGWIPLTLWEPSAEVVWFDFDNLRLLVLKGYPRGSCPGSAEEIVFHRGGIFPCQVL